MAYNNMYIDTVSYFVIVFTDFVIVFTDFITVFTDFVIALSFFNILHYVIGFYMSFSLLFCLVIHVVFVSVLFVCFGVGLALHYCFLYFVIGLYFI